MIIINNKMRKANGKTPNLRLLVIFLHHRPQIFLHLFYPASTQVNVVYIELINVVSVILDSSSIGAHARGVLAWTSTSASSSTALPGLSLALWYNVRLS
jgi:hypothetical protein